MPDERPWHYRNRFTNWLMAKPWQWNYRVVYRTLRSPAPDNHPVETRLRAAWLALTFPHVHHESED